MAKILISNEACNKYLSGKLASNNYRFTPDKNDYVFVFDNAHQAEEFLKEPGVAAFIADTPTDLVDYYQPDKSIRR